VPDEPLTTDTAEIFVENDEFTIGDLENPNHPAYTGDMPTPDVTGLIAAGDGAVQIVCGGRTSDVTVTVQTWSAPPPADLDTWEDIAEVSVIWPVPTVQLVGSISSPPEAIPVTLPKSDGDSFRVRAHVVNRDLEDGESHLVQIWPAPPAEPVLLKATDEFGTHERRPPD